MRRYLKGFTLVEVLVTISILSILASITVYGVNTVRARSRDSQRIADLNRVQAALTQHFTVEKQYPAATGATYTDKYDNLASSLTPTFITNLPKDPKTDPYTYQYNGDADNFALWAKMESSNARATSDNGKHPKSGVSDKVYYETGNGDSWADQIPNTLP